MQEDNNAIEKLVLVELMRLNGVILGVILGLLFGLGVFLATIILLLKGGDPVGPHLALLGQFFIGYRVTFAGSLIGFLLETVHRRNSNPYHPQRSRSNYRV